VGSTMGTSVLKGEQALEWLHRGSTWDKERCLSERKCLEVAYRGLHDGNKGLQHLGYVKADVGHPESKQHTRGQGGKNEPATREETARGQ